MDSITFCQLLSDQIFNIVFKYADNIFMINILEYQNYILFLKDLYFLRTQKNYNYSLSCFAEDLHMNTSGISRIFNNQRGPSKESAQKICSILFKKQIESMHFLDLVQMKHGRSVLQREQARMRVLERLQKTAEKLGHNELFLLNNWLDHAVREAAFLFRISPQKPPQDVAHYLGVSVEEVKESLAKLLHVGFIQDMGGYYYPKDSVVYSKSGTPNKSGRNINKQFIEKSLNKLENTPIEERYFASTLMNISSKKIKAAQEILEKFKKDFNVQMTYEEDTKDSIYCLGIQFFELGKKQ